MKEREDYSYRWTTINHTLTHTHTPNACLLALTHAQAHTCARTFVLADLLALALFQENGKLGTDGSPHIQPVALADSALGF